MTTIASRRLGLALAALSVAVGVALIVTSWTRLSATIDEGNHIATGMEWIQHGTYTLWTENPPLARVAVALGPYLDGARLPPSPAYAPGTPDTVSWKLGSDVLYRGGMPAHRRNLIHARAGTLPFFLVALLMTGLLAARAGGWAAGLIAVISVATLPPLLGNASVATTDVAFVAMFLLALWAFLRWVEAPTLGRAAVVGAAFALAVLTKFTALVFFPVAAAALLIGERNVARDVRGRVPGVLLAVLVAVLSVWAGYRFSFGRVDAPQFRVRALQSEILKPPADRRGAQAAFTATSFPAPAFFHGLLHLKAHNEAGHPAYLLGEQRQHGFRLFYPVTLFFKAPLPFLILVGLGLAALLSRWRDPEARRGLALAVAAVGVLAALIPSRMNLGVRHALVVYVLAAAAAAAGLARWLAVTQGRLRQVVGFAAVGLLAAQQGVAVASHPDHIAFFNALAGQDPGRILEGGDLDWGQGFFELQREVRARGVDRLHVALWSGITRLCDLDFPPLVALEPHTPVTGWVAVTQGMYSGRLESRSLRDPCDISSWRGKDTGLPPGWFRWLHAHQPVWRGGGIRLYYIKP